MGGPNSPAVSPSLGLTAYRDFVRYAPDANSQARFVDAESPQPRLTSHVVSGTGAAIGRGLERLTRSVGDFFRLVGHTITRGKIALPSENLRVRQGFVQAIKSELNRNGIKELDLPPAIRDKFVDEMSTNRPLTKRRIRMVLAEVDKVIALKRETKSVGSTTGTAEGVRQQNVKNHASLEKKFAELEKLIRKDPNFGELDSQAILKFKTLYRGTPPVDKMSDDAIVKELRRLAAGGQDEAKETTDVLGAKHHSLSQMLGLEKAKLATLEAEKQDPEKAQQIKALKVLIGNHEKELASVTAQWAKTLLQPKKFTSDVEQLRNEIAALKTDLENERVSVETLKQKADGIDFSQVKEAEVSTLLRDLKAGNENLQKTSADNQKKTADLQGRLEKLLLERFGVRFDIAETVRHDQKIALDPAQLKSTDARTPSQIRNMVRQSILVNIPNAEQWLKDVREAVLEQLRHLKIKGSDKPLVDETAFKHFEDVWKLDHEILKNGKRDLLADKAIDILKEQKPGPDGKVEMTLDALKQALQDKLVDRYQENAKLWVGMEEAEGAFAEQAPTFKPEETIQAWKQKTLAAHTKGLSSETVSAINAKVDELTQIFQKIVAGGSLLKIDLHTDENKTQLSRLIDGMSKPGAKLSDFVTRQLDEILRPYQLLEKNTGTNLSKLLPVTGGNDDKRLGQTTDESPYATITKLLGQKENARTGLVQLGSQSCWLVSVVNGLLNTAKGRDLLRTCFHQDGTCLFKARNKDGGTTEIAVTSKEIEQAMQEAQKLPMSRLEVALWLGVTKMRQDSAHFANVKDYPLGAMGEASDVATLFGLREGTTNGRTLTVDNDSVWAKGSNALSQDQLVFVHRRRGAATTGGHYMAVVGSHLDSVENEPKKTFDLYDSLAQDPSLAVDHMALNAQETLGQDVYRVFAFAFPEEEK